MIFRATLLAILVLQVSVTYGEDIDNNGINDCLEQDIAERYAPSLYFSTNNYLEPEPVEIMARNGQFLQNDDLIVRTHYQASGAVIYSSYSEDDPNINDWDPLYCEYHVKSYQGPNNEIHTSRACLEYGVLGGDSWGWNDEYEYGYVEDGQLVQEPGSEFDPVTYVHMLAGEESILIQYWYFFPFNSAVNDHEGDWEHINIYVDASTQDIEEIVYYQHENYVIIDDLSQIMLEEETHPVVFVAGTMSIDEPFANTTGFMSNGLYPRPGEWHDVTILPIVNDLDEEIAPTRYLNYRDIGTVIWPRVNRPRMNDTYGMTKEDFEANCPNKLWMLSDIYWGHYWVPSNGVSDFYFSSYAPVSPPYQPSWETRQPSGWTQMSLADCDFSTHWYCVQTRSDEKEAGCEVPVVFQIDSIDHVGTSWGPHYTYGVYEVAVPPVYYDVDDNVSYVFRGWSDDSQETERSLYGQAMCASLIAYYSVHEGSVYAGQIMHEEGGEVSYAQLTYGDMTVYSDYYGRYVMPYDPSSPGQLQVAKTFYQIEPNAIMMNGGAGATYINHVAYFSPVATSSVTTAGNGNEYWAECPQGDAYEGVGLTSTLLVPGEHVSTYVDRYLMQMVVTDSNGNELYYRGGNSLDANSNGVVRFETDPLQDCGIVSIHYRYILAGDGAETDVAMLLAPVSGLYYHAIDINGDGNVGMPELVEYIDAMNTDEDDVPYNEAVNYTPDRNVDGMQYIGTPDLVHLMGHYDHGINKWVDPAHPEKQVVKLKVNGDGWEAHASSRVTTKMLVAELTCSPDAELSVSTPAGRPMTCFFDAENPSIRRLVLQNVSVGKGEPLFKVDMLGGSEQGLDVVSTQTAEDTAAFLGGDLEQEPAAVVSLRCWQDDQSVKIQFTNPEKSKVGMAIYDVMGRKVRTLASADMGGTAREVIWDCKSGNGARVSSGIYFLKAEIGEAVMTRKIPLIW